MAAVPALAGACRRLYLDGMALPLSSPHGFEQAQPGNRLARVLVLGAALLGTVLLLAGGLLWLHYGTTVFFEMIAAGFAACF